MAQASTYDVEALNDLGEHFAAGFNFEPDASMVERFALALRNWALHARLPPYEGDLLYPSGPCTWVSSEPMAVRPCAKRSLTRSVTPTSSCAWEVTPNALSTDAGRSRGARMT